MSKAKEYYQYELGSSNWDPIRFLKTMNHKTLEDVKELIENFGLDIIEDGGDIYVNVPKILTELEKLKL